MLNKASSLPLDLVCPAQGSPVPSHRLVNLSRFSLAEPVGGSAPKFSTDLTTSGVKRSSDAAFSMSCPAQGSPVPAYRLYLKPVLTLVFIEPVGGSSPKFSTDVTRSDVQRSSFASFSLSCPAQGSPVPAFRFLSSIFVFFQSQWEALHPNSPPQTQSRAFQQTWQTLLPSHVQPKDHQVHPLGLSDCSWKYSSKTQCNALIINYFQSLVLAKGLPFHSFGYFCYLLILYRACWWINPKILWQAYKLQPKRGVQQTVQSFVSCPGVACSFV